MGENLPLFTCTPSINMLIEFQSGKTISSSSIVSIKLDNAVWCVKLENGYQVELAEGEFEWLMTLDGILIKINEVLALSMNAIIMLEPNESGFMIGWISEPPIQITKEKGTLLKEFLSMKEQHIVLADRIAFLQEKGIPVQFNTLEV